VGKNCPIGGEGAPLAGARGWGFVTGGLLAQGRSVYLNTVWLTSAGLFEAPKAESTRDRIHQGESQLILSVAAGCLGIARLILVALIENSQRFGGCCGAVLDA